jgi:hypothetical protein
MLRAEDYIKERKSIQNRIVKIDEEKKRLKLLLAPLNHLIAAAGAETTNGHGHEEDVGEDKPFPCDFGNGCARTGKKGFDSAQALGVHKAKIHRVKGVSKRSRVRAAR